MKKNNIFKFRVALSFAVFVCSLSAFVSGCTLFAKFFALQLGPNIISLFAGFSAAALTIVILTLLLTFLFGRFYCSVICPLGILQDFLGIFSVKKSSNSRNFIKTRYTIAAAVSGLLFFGWAAGLKLLDPYTNFGFITSNIISPLCSLFGRNNIYTGYTAVSAISGFIPFIILILLVVFKRRFFCTVICPVGTILGIAAKKSILKLNISDDKCLGCGLCTKQCPAGAINIKEKTINSELCVKCLKCFSSCKREAVVYTASNKKTENFSISRRNFIAGTILIAAGFAAGTVTALNKSKNVIKNKLRAILPPGAESHGHLYLNCTDCRLCIENCPEKIIVPCGNGYDTLHIDYSNKGKCRYDCNVCSYVCPANAIKKLSLEEKQLCRIGIVQVFYDKCIGCGLCTEACPAKALTVNDRKLEYNASLCIGCGACESACHMNALKVVGIVSQSQAQKN